MQAKTLFVAGIIAIGTISAGSAYGFGVKNFNGSGSHQSWNDPNNWDPTGRPGPNDQVNIPNGQSVDFDVTNSSYQVIGSLHVASGGELFILGGGTLPLMIDGEDSVSDSGISNINGPVVLTQAGSMLEFIDTDQTVQGSSYIRGLHSDATVQIDDSLTLVNLIRFEGAFVIQAASSEPESAEFQCKQNSSATERVALRANLANSTLTIASGIRFTEMVHSVGENDYFTKYEAVDADGATLRIDCAAPDLSGDFLLDGGSYCSTTLEINDVVATLGSFAFTKGMLLVGENGEFIPSFGDADDYTPGTYYSDGCEP